MRATPRHHKHAKADFKSTMAKKLPNKYFYVCKILRNNRSLKKYGKHSVASTTLVIKRAIKAAITKTI